LYDANENIISKTDARGVTTTTTYDVLNRPLSKTYSDGVTAPVNFFYDQNSVLGHPLANPIGRLTYSYTPNDATASVFSYDSMGRIAKTWQCVPRTCGYELDYTYNSVGGMITQSLGIGIVLTQAYDSAARTTQLTSNWTDAQHPSTLLFVDPSAGYTAAGAISNVTYGNGLIETSVYNRRLQPLNKETCGMQLINGGGEVNLGYNCVDVLNLAYSFTDANGHNNGNLTSLTSTATQVFTRTYTYDVLNRLSTMSSPADASGCYGLSWNYDAWSNRVSQAANTTACSQSYPTIGPNNQFTNAPYQYDAAGNMTADGNHIYAYDAENRLIKVDGGATANYVYDATGRRAEKITPAGATEYLYDQSGDVVTEIGHANTPTVYYIYLAGALVAEYENNTTYFISKDHLGSSRIVTAMDGTVCDSIDYLPYGEQISGGSCTTHKFTGKERDNESGLDNFQARYVGSNLGRFMSPDPRYFQTIMLVDPQQFNLYSYARNNPLRWVDPLGENLFLFGDIGWLDTNVLYRMVGGEEAFNAAFHVSDGQVLLNEGADTSKFNSGQKQLLDIVNSSDNYVFFAGISGSDAARLFQGTVGKNGKLNDHGKILSNSFTCGVDPNGNSYTSGCGTLGGTTGRPGSFQPANLANGDPVFAVIAYNEKTVQTQEGPAVAGDATSAGVGKVVDPVRYFMHESAENLAFRAQGNWVYSQAHGAAIQREIQIQKDLHLGGGFAGGAINSQIPKH